MKVLLIGASGYVGTLVLPFLRARAGLTFSVFDLTPPADPEVAYLPGSVADPEAVARAVAGHDAVLYMAMGRYVDDELGAGSSYDVNVKGVHFALSAAAQAGVRRFVHTSTGSVYDGQAVGPGPLTEDEPCRPVSMYGWTKYLGELVCERFTRLYGLSVIALRLWAPVSEDEWLAHRRQQRSHPVTGAADLAHAYAAALTVEHAGFDAVSIAGDCTGARICLDKARRLLGWAPTCTRDLSAAG